jgi:hypothetical protein
MPRNSSAQLSAIRTYRHSLSDLKNGSLTDRNLCRQTYRRYVRLFDEGGAAALFAPRVKSPSEIR